MLLAPIPFEYAKLLDPGDRLRRRPNRPTIARRVRGDRKV
jgi:hypothetical protein